MSTHQVTLEVPARVYERIQQTAEQLHRPLDRVLVEALIAGASMIEQNSTTIEADLDQLAQLNDAALWRAARSSMPRVEREQLAELNDKQQRLGLKPEEDVEAEALLSLYEQTVLVRAKAAALLRERGYDVSDPAQFTPVD